MQGCPSSLIGNGLVTLSEGLSLLVGEHVPLREQLEVLFSLCTKVETEEEKRVALEELVKEVVSFSTNLEFHSVREEDILFRMMEVYLGKNGGPIAVMEYEHEQANGFIKTFLSNTENHAQSSEEIIENTNLIKDAYHTLLDHFMKEEQVLYPMAEKLFSEEEKELFKQKVTQEKGNI
jgi:regulator of cell morphogenesis and NO signaling